MSEVKVFLSYVADTSVFVEEFAKHFFTLGGDFLRVDWLVENVDAGDAVSTEIADRIKSAGIFIAFICKDYPGRMAAKELAQAVELRKAGQSPIIVPVTLGHTGRSWWKGIKQEAGLGDMADQPFFKPGTNAWSLPDAAGVMAIQRLRRSLAEKFAA